MTNHQELSAVVFDVKRFAVHDGPGIRTTVHLKGCPLRCRWCHNPEGWLAEPAEVPWPGSLSGRVIEGTRMCGRRVTVADLLSEVTRDLPFFAESSGGVTFSGGEPLAWPEFLEAAFAACRREGIPTCLDTSGYAPAAVWERILPQVDLVLFDLKLIDDSLHRHFTGVPVAPILANLRRLAESGRPAEIRFPLIPGITDTPVNLVEIISFLASLPGERGVAVLPYHRAAAGKYRRLGIACELEDLLPPDKQRQEAVCHVFHLAGFNARIGG